jgi:nucleolar protein 56
MGVLMSENKLSQVGDQLDDSHYWYTGCKSGKNQNSLDPEIFSTRFKQEGAVFRILPTWEEAVIRGTFRNKDEYFSSLQDICIRWSKQVLRIYNSSDEVRLIKLMLILRETDLMISRLSEQILVWQRMIDDTLGSDESVKRKCDPIREMALGDGYDGISLLCRDLVHMKESRAHLVHDISAKCEILLPNCSVLVGPLVAARLLVEAGSLKRLSRMPASRIQILGARNALFSHLSSGSPSPKHGLIFEHKRVHAAPRKSRGRVARTLAANLAVASRIDYFRKIQDLSFLEKSRLRIEKAGR